MTRKPDILDPRFVRERALEARERMSPCQICPRNCGVHRLEEEEGFCGVGDTAIVSAAFPHHGEEDCLRGVCGSGTIFFSGCNLRCIFCQNYSLSHYREGKKESARALALQMLYLQECGCHNLNLVSPTQVVPQILEALAEAVENGFWLPVVYNTGGYDSVETLRLWDGIVDIYMPDFKYWDPAVAEQCSGAKDYPEVARETVREMHRQVGDLILDERGIARHGLLIRHLVLPHDLAGTRDVMRFVATEISPHTFVNIMGQYRPCGQAHRVEELRRPVNTAEVLRAKQMAKEEGLSRFAE